MTDMPEEEYIARKLTFIQWDYLTDHVNGWRPIVYDKGEQSTRMGLMARELIYPDAREKSSRPTRTLITEKGRRVMGYVLGFMADTLLSHEFDIDAYAEMNPKPMEKYGYGKIGRTYEYRPRHGVNLAPPPDEP